MSELSQRSTNHLSPGAVAGLGESIDALSQALIKIGADAHLATPLNAIRVAGHE